MPSVYQRKSDGRWVLATAEKGKQKYRYFKTEEEARAALVAGDQARARTLGAFVETWLASKKDVYRASTHALRSQVLPRFIRPLAHLDLADVTPLAVAGALVTSTLKSSRKAGAYSMLRVCLNDAVAMGLIAENPMLRVPRPGHRPKRRDYWTPEQAKQFLAAVEAKPYGPVGLFPFLLLTGLRVSEALGLEWGDVDLERRRITVKRALVYNVGQRYVEEDTKTASSRRVIALTGAGVQAMARRRAATTGQGRVFTGRFGNTPEQTNLRRALRHVHAMLALEATGDVYAVQRRLGHSNVTTTVAIYGYSKRDDSETAEALDRLLDKPGRDEAPAKPASRTASRPRKTKAEEPPALYG
jgi:integrase